jgi:hypothetical protein
MYQSRAYDDENGEPVVVLVTTGQHDVSRLINLFNGRLALCEHLGVASQMLRQVRRHNGGRNALALLKKHGGPDFTRDVDYAWVWRDPRTDQRYDLTRPYLDVAGEAWVFSGWLHREDGERIPVMSWETDDAALSREIYADIPLPQVTERFGPLHQADAVKAPDAAPAAAGEQPETAATR